MKRLIIYLTVSNFLTLMCVAQSLSLDDCMRYAVTNSVVVCRQQLANDDSRANYNEAVASLFPTVNVSVGGITNFGRSIDPATNAYTSVTTFNNSYGINISMTLFDGLQGINTVRAMKVARKRSIIESEIIRDEVAIKTLVAYMDVVYYSEAVNIAREHLEASRKTLELMQQQYSLGLKSVTDIAELESQEANYDYLLTTEENNLALAYIKLREVMNYPQDKELKIATEITSATIPSVTSEVTLMKYALANNPRIISSRHKTEQQRINLARAKGGFVPSLYLYGGYNTNYHIDFDNKAAYSSFGTQLKNNRGGYIQLSLAIPIFNNLKSYSAKRRAKNAYLSAQLELSATEYAVESEICDTWQQMKGFHKQYIQGEKKVAAAQLAYDGAEHKFKNGIISALDLQTTANSLLQAKSDRLRARLQYIIKSRMVDYYNGEPLIK